MVSTASRRSVAIVGGGIAGTALAAALDPARHDVTIYEAAPQRAAYGGAFAIWPSTLEALQRIGIRAAVEDGATDVGSGSIRDLAGRPLLTLGAPGLVMVPRGALITAIAEAVPDTVQRVTADVTDPSALAEDLVVGADGVRSRVRPLVHPQGERGAARRASPFVALRGTSPGVPSPDVVGEYWGPDLLAGIVPAAGATYWFSAHRSSLGPEPLDVAAVLAEARERTSAAGEAISSTLAQAADDPHQVTATRLWTAPPMARYVRGRYVVIGDAAHAMLPNLGRGACEAVVDAVTLADALDHGSLRRWQARRLPVTQAMRLAATGLMHAETNQRLERPRVAALAALGRVAQRAR